MARSRASRAADPSTPLEDLAKLAHEHPELRPIVAANPSTYPDLLAWLRDLGDSAVDAALAERGTAEPDAVISTDLLRASDPATSQEELARLAHEHPELRATIAANPNAYDDLRAWIAETDGTALDDGVSDTRHATDGSPDPEPGTKAEAEPRSRLVLAGLLAAIGARWAALGISGAQTAVAASAVVVGLVATGGGVYNAVQIPRVVETLGVVVSGGTPVAGGSDGTVSGGGPQAIVVPEPRYVPTVLILDASGSMVRDVTPGVTRMDAAKAAATTLVNGFGEDAQVGLTVFGTSTGNSDADRAAGCTDIRRLVPVGTLDRDGLTTAIAGIRESGFTPIGPSLRDAVEQLAEADEGLIVVVSDGVDTCAPPSSCDVAAELRAVHPNVTIHAVGFAVDADEQAQENLECVAQAGGGVYVDASNADQLAARLRALTDPIATAGTIGVSGIDAVRLGMSLDQVEAVLGDLGDAETILDIQYIDCDYGRLAFKDGRLWGIEPLDSIGTSEGIAVGDDLDTATAIYGPGVPGDDDAGTYQTFQAAPGSDTAYRIYYTGNSTTIVKVVVCICGVSGGGPSEISNWQVSFDGLGPLTFDSTLADASAVLGDATSDFDGCSPPTLDRKGIAARIFAVPADGDPGKPIVLFAFGGEAGDRLPRTERGVGLGSTRADWLSAYPESSEVHVALGDDYLILTDAKGVSLIGGLSADGGTIDSIQIGHATTWQIYGCD